MRNRRLRGLTLIEIIVSLAILILLAGLLFGATREARREGFRANATSDGRQIYLAIAAYSEDAGRWHIGPMDDIVRSGQLTDARILRAPTDDLPLGYGGEILSRATLFRYESEYPVSWETHFRGTWLGAERFYDLVASFDSNPGILALRVLGDKHDLKTPLGANLVFLYSGPMLRVRRDGSIQRARYAFRRYRGAPGELGGQQGCISHLFTDVRDPELCRVDE